MTSWEPVTKWYNKAVGKEGHYYHQQVIIPHLLKIIDLKNASVLDLACGQGIFGRKVPRKNRYLGLDISPSLIKAAKHYDKSQTHDYIVHDATKLLKVEERFSHAVILLALQNIEEPKKVIKNAYQCLEPNGRFVMVLNHPCFRIPRQSSWEVDEGKKLQYRRLDSYQSKMKIPIQMHPSKGKKSENTWSFHHPLSSYTHWLHEAGFAIQWMDELCSDKVSQGKAAKMENRSRKEFPLFLTIVAKKQQFPLELP